MNSFCSACNPKFNQSTINFEDLNQVYLCSKHKNLFRKFQLVKGLSSQSIRVYFMDSGIVNKEKASSPSRKRARKKIILRKLFFLIICIFYIHLKTLLLHQNYSHPRTYILLSCSHRRNPQ